MDEIYKESVIESRLLEVLGGVRNVYLHIQNDPVIRTMDEKLYPTERDEAFARGF